jgi:predicted HicB family RNase H-like nuclease
MGGEGHNGTNGRKLMTEPPDDLVRVLNLRLDGGLHQQLTAEARRSVRSLNGEIIFRLRRSLDQQSDEAAS